MMTKLVTCYKDVNEHDRHCNGNNGAHVQGGRQLDLPECVLVDDSNQMWRPVLESAWHEHSSLPGCQP